MGHPWPYRRATLAYGRLGGWPFKRATLYGWYLWQEPHRVGGRGGSCAGRGRLDMRQGYEFIERALSGGPRHSCRCGERAGTAGDWLASFAGRDDVDQGAELRLLECWGDNGKLV